MNRSSMSLFRGLCALFLVLFACACDTVPITGRQQLSLHGVPEMNALGAREYENILNESDVIEGTRDARMVSSVGNRIKNAVEDYFRQQGQSDRLKGYEWEFTLIDEDEVNAFCLPGGKVAVYNGILDVTQSEAGLAVVMGHEIAHAVAGHGNERMSQGLLAEVAGIALAVAVSGEDEDTQNLVLAAYGLGTNVGVLLPFSRLHESEADKLGLIFMAMAGYDPNEAPKFWRRMAENDDGEGGLEFLSTHPSNETRIKDLESAVPQAQAFIPTSHTRSTGAQPAKRSETSQPGFPKQKHRPATAEDDE